MKKILALLLSVLLVSAIFAIPVSAVEIHWAEGDYEIDSDTKDLKVSNAYGYVFDIVGVNTAPNETNTIYTSDETWKTTNGWPVSVVLENVEGDVYEVVTVYNAPQSTGDWKAAVEPLTEGQIVMMAHSSGSRPNAAGDYSEGAAVDYANWQDKVAALALKAGDKITFSGIDLEAGTATNATATVQDDPNGEPSVPVVPSVNVAAGKSYTYSQMFRQGGKDVNWGWDANAPVAYPDEEDKTMTDGVIAATDVAYDDAVWAGWNHNAPEYSELGYSFITVDLGEVIDLAEASIYLGASGLGQGIGAKNMTVEIFVSDDGEEFESVGSAVPEDSEEVSCVKTTVKFDTAVSGRYVQFRMVRGGWMFVSEVEVYNAGSGSTTTVVEEEIDVDGDLSDNGWKNDGWTEVTPDNGYWQALPTTDTLSYKYQLRTDDTKLYVAVEIDCAAVAGGNGAGTNVRFWINTDDEATVYTHFYDVFVGGTGAKYNQAKDDNKGAAIENSTINAVLTTKGEKTYVEFSVDLAEFNGAEGFNYFICVSNKVNENVCLYYPANEEPAEGESRLDNLPYKAWYTEGQGVADVEELKLGEVEISGGSNTSKPDDEKVPGDASNMIIFAIIALVAIAGSAVVIKTRR